MIILPYGFSRRRSWRGPPMTPAIGQTAGAMAGLMPVHRRLCSKALRMSFTADGSG